MIKQFYFKQFNLACQLFALILNVKQSYLTHKKDQIGCYHFGPMDLGAMSMKGYAAFPQAPASLAPHHQIV